MLKEFKDVFAWSYQDMPGIDLKIVEHCILHYLNFISLKKNEITNRLCKQYKSPTQSQYFFVKIIHGYSLVFLLQVYLRHLAKKNSFTNLK